MRSFVLLSAWVLSSSPALAETVTETETTTTTSDESGTTRTTVHETTVQDPALGPWDDALAHRTAIFGGIAKGGWTLRAPLQFNTEGPVVAPSLAFARGLVPGIELGLDVSFSFPVVEENTRWQGAFPGLWATLPLRISVLNDARMSASLIFQPGFAFFRWDDTLRRYFVPLRLAFNLGWRFGERFVIGGSFDAPMYVVIDPASGQSAFVAPLLVGPVAELRVLDFLSLFAEAKAGIHIESNAPQVLFANRMILGLAGHF